ncbi:unnamed protein product [Oikopleura dioica]|uniref:SEA domain-containing protein n=1 Tax=Oikopleura dioica TaxID=34765 RepID=E4Y1K2_OIKDI|nr:unnamed protein product [Oikopleura dioica]
MKVPLLWISLFLHDNAAQSICTDVPKKSTSSFDTQFYEYACTLTVRVENNQINDADQTCATVKARWEATVTNAQMYFTKDFENSIAPTIDGNGRNVVPYSVKLQLLDAAFKYDQSPTAADFADKLNELLKTFYVESEFFDMISVDSSSCSQTDFSPLKSSATSPISGTTDNFKDSVKVSGQVKLDKNYATEPKALFIYSEDTVGVDAVSYDKSLIVTKMNDEIVPDVFQQPTDAEFKFYEYSLSKDTADPEVILLDYTAHYSPIGNNTELTDGQTEAIRADVEEKFNDFIGRGDSFISETAEAPTAEKVARKYTSDEVFRANIITLCVTLAVAALLVILIGAIAGVAYNQIQKQVQPPVGVAPASGLTVMPLENTYTVDTTGTRNGTTRNGTMLF